ncbi:O-antigen/teichoic acid export membrane protein [Novosphingobium sp. PhB165]|nr:O-antigen/teichoic acid export membrane protein [Novosphingobium sp. PhB165]
MITGIIVSETLEARTRLTPLIAVAVAGQAIGYGLSVLLARRLSFQEFEAYVVASAAFVLLATFAARGTEKYTLVQLPVLLERGEWGLAKGFVRFGARRTILTAIVTGVLLALWSGWFRNSGDAVRLALIATGLSLPAGASMHYAVEVLSAMGRPVRALTIFKLFVPGLTLALISALVLLRVPIGGTVAVACWGVSWAIALALMVRAIGRAAPGALRRVTPIAEPEVWRAGARPFLVYRLALALLGQSGVIALDLLQPSAVAVGAYAAAAGTAALASILAAATNRAYGRELALRLNRRDFDGLNRARRQRILMLGPLVGVFICAALAYPERILSPYGAIFAREGANAFRILAVSTAFSVILSLAPTYLKARKRNRVTYVIVTAAGFGQFLLLLLLVPCLGATGAALAHAVATCGLYGVSALMAHRELIDVRKNLTIRSQSETGA